MLGVLAGVGLLVVVLVVAVVVLAGRGDDGLDAAGASESLERFVADADFDESTVLVDCPLGALGPVRDEVADVVRPPEGAEEGAEVYEGDENQPGIVCFLDAGADDDRADYVEVYATRTGVGGYAAELARVFPDSELTTADPVGFRNGEIFGYCAEAAEDSGALDGCGADWVVVDEDLAIGIYLESARAQSAAEAADALRELLPGFVEALAAAEPRFED